MNIGFLGLGKLGLPVALAIESKGHKVQGFDVSPQVMKIIETRQFPYMEIGVQELLDRTKLKWSMIPQMVADCDLIFLAIQTPHESRFEGSTRLPEDRADFDYTYLKDVIKKVAEEAELQKKQTTIAVISTCLPGTFKREIATLGHYHYINYVYNPFFIAMGEVIPDFLDPEFVLIGAGKSQEAVNKLKEFYSTIHDKPIFVTDITTAEGIKVFYNTFITMKTVLANIYGEMSQKLGMNVDDIYKALSLATDRIISPKYLKAGMGDGGGCHPRDNIALSHVARIMNISHNIFEDLMEAREDHADWLAKLIVRQQLDTGLPIVLLGKSFKPETDIQTGSPALLVASILDEFDVPYLHVGEHDNCPLDPSVYFIATQHDKYKDLSSKVPEGSVILDPFGFIPDHEGVKVIRIGRP